MMRNQWQLVWYRIERAWNGVLGLFSPLHCAYLDLVTAIEQGEGSSVITWWWDGDAGEDDSLTEILADVDEVIRRAPAPLGVDECFIRVAVYGPRPQDRNGVEDALEGRELLRVERLCLDRYYDWKRGDGRERLRHLLESNEPTPQAPVVVVQVLPLGGAMGRLLEAGQRPQSAWTR
jgi:hypothetical protein